MDATPPEFGFGEPHDLKEDLSVLNSRYGVIVPLVYGGATVRKSEKIGLMRYVMYDALPYSAASLPVAEIRRKLALYPPDYIRSLGLKEIKLTLDLSESDFFSKIPELGGIAVTEKGLLYLDLSTDPTGNSFHHELSHFSDGEIGGLRGIRGRQRWISLNPKGSRAYKVVPEYFINRDIDQGVRPEGFGSFYGTFSPAEDRAEVLQLIMRSAGYGRLQYILQKDKILERKVTTVLEAIKRRSQGKVGDGYFDDLISGKVNEQYWDK